MMKKSLVAAAAALIVAFASSAGDAIVRVKPRGPIFSPTLENRNELFQILMAHHNPQLAERVTAGAIWVAHKPNDNTRVITFTEDNAGELLPCVAIVVEGGVLPASVEQTRGDGSFSGQGEVIPMSGGLTLVMFHGAQSTNTAMRLHVTLQWTNAPPVPPPHTH